MLMPVISQMKEFFQRNSVIWNQSNTLEELITTFSVDELLGTIRLTVSSKKKKVWELKTHLHNKRRHTTTKRLVYGWDHHWYNSSKTSMDSILQCKECITILAQMIIQVKEFPVKDTIHSNLIMPMNKESNQFGQIPYKMLNQISKLQMSNQKKTWWWSQSSSSGEQTITSLVHVLPGTANWSLTWVTKMLILTQLVVEKKERNLIWMEMLKTNKWNMKMMENQNR